MKGLSSSGQKMTPNEALQRTAAAAYGLPEINK
jgi:hypothetical protein